MLRVLLGLHVHPFVRNQVPRQIILDLMGTGGPAMADDTNSGAQPWRGCVPVIQEITEGRVMALVGRARWSREVVVQTHLIDGADRGLGIVIGCEKNSLGSRS